MSTDELLAVLASRSLQVVMLENGTLSLRGNKALATPSLLRVLKLPVHREELLKRLKDQPRVKAITVVQTPAGSPPVQPPVQEFHETPKTDLGSTAEVVTTEEMDTTDPFAANYPRVTWNATEWMEFGQLASLSKSWNKQ